MLKRKSFLRVSDNEVIFRFLLMTTYCTLTRKENYTTNPIEVPLLRYIRPTIDIHHLRLLLHIHPPIDLILRQISLPYHFEHL